MTNVLRSSHEPIFIKKAAYKLAKVPLYVTRPKRLKTLYIARKGRTRQIMNEKELMETMQFQFGDQVCTVIPNDLKHYNPFLDY